MDVPQGSVLGPILFILYVNDLANIFTDCNCTKYADDTNLYCHAPTFTEVQSLCKLQDCLDLTSKWLFENQLVVSASKSSIMVVTRKSLPISNLNFHLCGNIIPISEETKLLGVLIDSKLTYKGHIQAMLKKLSSKVGLEQEQLCLIYNASIQSNLDYCITVWGSCYKSYLAKLQRLQNRCARIITRNFDYNTPSSALISSLAWMSVETRYKYFVGILNFCLNVIYCNLKIIFLMCQMIYIILYFFLLNYIYFIIVYICIYFFFINLSRASLKNSLYLLNELPCQNIF